MKILAKSQDHKLFKKVVFITSLKMILLKIILEMGVPDTF